METTEGRIWGGGFSPSFSTIQGTLREKIMKDLREGFVFWTGMTNVDREVSVEDIL